MCESTNVSKEARGNVALARHTGEGIVIGDDFEVYVKEVGNEEVKLVSLWGACEEVDDDFEWIAVGESVTITGIRTWQEGSAVRPLPCGNVEIEVQEVRDDGDVALCVRAPKSVPVWRAEISKHVRQFGGPHKVGQDWLNGPILGDDRQVKDESRPCSTVRASRRVIV
jgi:sRNA-binding carbon storage regulator CsrA